MITVHHAIPLGRGAHQRLEQAFDQSRPPQERQNTMKLSLGNQHLPHHVRNMLFNNPGYPVGKLVDRLKSLADVNPDVRKKAKPLLDQLANFFDPEKESAPWPQQELGFGVLPSSLSASGLLLD
jgi:hypothetical protein